MNFGYLWLYTLGYKAPCVPTNTVAVGETPALVVQPVLMNVVNNNNVVNVI